MSDALEQVKELLNYDEKKIKEQLLTRNDVLGFFAKNNLTPIKVSLEDLFTTLTSSNYYPMEWVVVVKNAVRWIQEYQGLISERRNNKLYQCRFSPNMHFHIVDAKTLNENNPDGNYFLLKRIGTDQGKVLYSATMPKLIKRYCYLLM